MASPRHFEIEGVDMTLHGRGSEKTWKAVVRELSGWLRRYQKLVTNASQGAILG